VSNLGHLIFGQRRSTSFLVRGPEGAQFGVYLHNACPRAGLPLEQEIAVAGPRLVRAMHSSSLVAGRVQIDWEKAFDAIKTHFADGVYTFEVEREEAEANKRIINEVIQAYG